MTASASFSSFLIHGGGLNLLSLIHRSENILRSDVHPVLVALSVDDHAQRRDRNIIFFQQLWTQVAGGIGTDPDLHAQTLPPLPLQRRRTRSLYSQHPEKAMILLSASAAPAACFLLTGTSLFVRQRILQTGELCLFAQSVVHAGRIIKLRMTKGSPGYVLLARNSKIENCKILLQVNRKHGILSLESSAAISHMGGTTQWLYPTINYGNCLSTRA